METCSSPSNSSTTVQRVSEAKSSPSTSRITLHYLIYPQARLHQTLNIDK